MGGLLSSPQATGGVRTETEARRPVLFSRRALDQLLERGSRPAGPVLSIYLDVDQSRAANLNRGFEGALKHMLRTLKQEVGDPQRQSELAACASRVLEFFSSYQPRARGLAMFCDTSGAFFWHRELMLNLRNDARLDDEPNVRPLLEALDEYERYCVLLANREEARLFTVFLGQIEEHREIAAAVRSRHIRGGAGKDHMRSQMQIQRKAGVHSLWHLKQAADSVARLAELYPFDRLVMAGQTEAVNQLYHLLAKRLQARVVKQIPLPIHASEQQVLEETLCIEQEIERAAESRTLDELITASCKSGQAVLGLQPTLAALREGRIWRLVYADGSVPAGAQCVNCRSLFSDGVAACEFCGASLKPVPDLVERVAQLVVEAGGKAEQMRGEPAARLAKSGGVGAFLRF